jgi:hypothetical protein
MQQRAHGQLARVIHTQIRHVRRQVASSPSLQLHFTSFILAQEHEVSRVRLNRLSEARVRAAANTIAAASGVQRAAHKLRIMRPLLSPW